MAGEDEKNIRDNYYKLLRGQANNTKDYDSDGDHEAHHRAKLDRERDKLLKKQEKAFKEEEKSMEAGADSDDDVPFFMMDSAKNV